MVVIKMDQNFPTNNKKQSEKCPSAVLNAVPINFEKIKFADLKTGENYQDKAIIGKICQLNPIGKRANGFIRKLVISDALVEEFEIPPKLTVFLLDQFAQDSNAAELEGYIIIANFLLEKSTLNKGNELPFQVLVKKEETQVLFGRKIPPDEAKSIKNIQKPTKKKIYHSKDRKDVQTHQKKQKVSNDEESHIILANSYEYVPIEALQESESKITYNVYGIVEKCNLKVIQGKRTQILDLTITDETEAGFNCSVFGAKDETFPDVYPGDIVRIHRMQVYKFRGRLKGRCLSPKFILIFSKNNKDHKPKTVAKSFTFVPDDSARVKELFDWYNKMSEPKLISELSRGDYANIVCQVIGVYCSKKTETVILKIWDGTKTNQFESSHWGLKEEVIDEKLFTIAKNHYVVLFVYGQHIASAAELKPGQYIEVRDAHLYCPATNPDDCKLCLHTGTKEGRGIEVLNEEDEKVKKLKQRLEKIVVDVMECGNQTDDLLSQNNSLFLNCDISAFTSSQKPAESQIRNEEEEVATVEALNKPLKTSTESQKTVVSVLEAAVKPGQYTQEFGGSQREALNVEEEMPASTQEANENKPSFPPFSDDSETEWWKSVPAVSATDDYSTVKPSTLAEIIQHDVPHKFRALCAVFSYRPNSSGIQKLIHLCCPKCLYITEDAMPSIPPFEERDGLFYFYCPECSIKEADKNEWPVLNYIYLISFELHDGTGSSSLETHLWGENAVKFFKGITPEQALKDQAASDSVFQMLWGVCPNCRPFNSTENNFSAYPILDCCILSYTTPGGTCYQIFGTRLL
ncbi:uncharacterized protein LOC129966027 isoform X2 [Argiope bruennichi]|uniref:uncharacterized protein LOC129966027 isoform X2 n=1 Tax=Argiope bruennichi TaxID=94029 RepID=UPI0024950193|nr:uncharacterized protein LOC129966027 isoform X2 [Argiope bruennichi]